MRSIGSGDVNAYIRAISGGDFTAKDFRTWAGTVEAAKFLLEQPLPAIQAGCKRVVNVMLDAVSNELGKTPSICRKCYVDPRIINAWLKGCTMTKPRGIRGLSRMEALTMRILECR